MGNSGVDVCDINGNIIDLMNTSDGLTSNFINDLIEVNGKIFIGTPAGLAISSDGGMSFTVKTTADGLPSNNISDLEINGNRLFIATNTGFSYTDNEGVSFVNKNTADGLPSNNLYNLLLANDGALYIGTFSGVSVSTDNGDSFNDAGILDSSISRFIEINPGEFLINSVARGFIYSGGELSRIQEFNDGYELPFREIEIDNTGKMYFLTEGGYLTSIDDGLTFDKTMEFEFYGSDLRFLEVSGNGSKIYLGGDSGLYISTDSGATFNLIDSSGGLSFDFVYGLHVDNSDNIYVLTYQFPSLARLNISIDDGASFISKSSADGIGDNNMQDVIVDNSNGYIYVASWGELQDQLMEESVFPIETLGMDWVIIKHIH